MAEGKNDLNIQSGLSAFPLQPNQLPVYKIEYMDGTTNGAGNANFFGVATENYVNVTSKAACYAATTGTAS